MTEAQKEYIITEKLLSELEYYAKGSWVYEVRSRPYKSDAVLGELESFTAHGSGGGEPIKGGASAVKFTIITEPQKEFDCIHYPMCHRACKLLYCPKKARGDECEDYKSTKESSDAVLEDFKKWFEKYCECDEEADAYMVFFKAYHGYIKLRTKER